MLWLYTFFDAHELAWLLHIDMRRDPPIGSILVYRRYAQYYAAYNGYCIHDQLYD